MTKQTMMLLVVLCGPGACSGGKATDASDAGEGGVSEAGHDGEGAVNDGSVRDQSSAAEQGAPYSCAGGFTLTADGGLTATDAGSSATCVVGQTFCYILLPQLPQPSTTVEGAASCRDFVPDGFPACAQDPTCACFCDPSRGGFYCTTECRCSETNGFATMYCQRI